MPDGSKPILWAIFLYVSERMLCICSEGRARGRAGREGEGREGGRGREGAARGGWRAVV